MTEVIKQYTPIVLGTDFGAYGIVRGFYEILNQKISVIGKSKLAAIDQSSLVTVETHEDIYNLETFIEIMHAKYVQLTANNAPKPYILVPVGDIYVSLVAEAKAYLSREFFIYTMDPWEVEQLSNKREFQRIASEINILVPETLAIEVTHDVEWIIKKAKNLTYPMILKPEESVDWMLVEFAEKEKVFTVNSCEETVSIVSAIRAAGYTHALLLQEYIDGLDSNMWTLNAYVDQNHKVRFTALGNVLLEDHTDYAKGNYLAILPDYNEQLIEDATRFLEYVEYTGFADFDIKYNERNGKYYFFEINLRQGRSSYFAFLNGINLAEFPVKDALNLYKNDENVTLQPTPKSEMLWLGADANSILQKYVEMGASTQALLKLQILINDKQVGWTYRDVLDVSRERLKVVERIEANYRQRLAQLDYHVETGDNRKYNSYFAILGGMGTTATEGLINAINQGAHAVRDQDFFDYVVFNHASVPDRSNAIVDGNAATPLPYLVNDIRLINQLKPRYVVIACNTAHYWYDELVKSTNLEVIHMPKLAVDKIGLADSVAKRVLVLGTRGTVSDGIYRNLLEKNNQIFLKPDEELQKLVDSFIFDEVKAKGENFSSSAWFELLAEVNKLPDVDHVILGCTELSFANAKVGLGTIQEDKYLDAEKLLVEVIIDSEKAYGNRAK